MAENLTLEVLKEIRDGVCRTNERLDRTNERLDQTVNRLDETVERLDRMVERQDRTDERQDQMLARMDQMAERQDQTVDCLNRLERRQAESEIRLATELTEVVQAVKDVHTLLATRLDLRDRVEDHERRLSALEQRR